MSSSVLSTQVSYLTDVNVICGGTSRAAPNWSNRRRILGVWHTHMKITHLTGSCEKSVWALSDPFYACVCVCR